MILVFFRAHNGRRINAAHLLFLDHEVDERLPGKPVTGLARVFGRAAFTGEDLTLADGVPAAIAPLVADALIGKACEASLQSGEAGDLIIDVDLVIEEVTGAREGAAR